MLASLSRGGEPGAVKQQDAGGGGASQQYVTTLHVFHGHSLLRQRASAPSGFAKPIVTLYPAVRITRAGEIGRSEAYLPADLKC